MPGLPLLGGSFDQFEVGSVVIGAADYFRQVGGRRALAGDGALLEEADLVAASAQCQGGGQAEDTGADYTDAHGGLSVRCMTDKVFFKLGSVYEVYTGRAKSRPFAIGCFAIFQLICEY